MVCRLFSALFREWVVLLNGAGGSLNHFGSEKNSFENSFGGINQFKVANVQPNSCGRGLQRKRYIEGLLLMDVVMAKQSGKNKKILTPHSPTHTHTQKQENISTIGAVWL